MFTTSFRDSTLNTLDSHFCALLTAITDWRAGTFTEASYTGYSATRPGITFGSPSTSGGARQRANSSTVTFGQNTAASQDVIGYAIMSASSGGTCKAIGVIETADTPLFATVDPTNDTFTTQTAHGLSAGERVYLLGAAGAAIPAGVSENTIYFVRTTGLTSTAFTVSTTGAGGTIVDITAAGAVLVIPFTPVTVATSSTPEFTAGQLVVQL